MENIQKKNRILESNPYSGCKTSSWRLFATTIGIGYGVGPQNANIFLTFFHDTIDLDGQNFQIGALGTLGIAVGAVSNSGDGGPRFPESSIVNPRQEKPGYSTKGWKAIIE